MTEQGHLFKKKRNRRKSDRRNVSVRPTPDQLLLLHERAASFGFKSLSQYLIERGLREGEMIMSVDRERLERLLFELRRVGRNVNQISRAVNLPRFEKAEASFSALLLNILFERLQRCAAYGRGVVTRLPKVSTPETIFNRGELLKNQAG